MAGKSVDPYRLIGISPVPDTLRVKLATFAVFVFVKFTNILTPLTKLNPGILTVLAAVSAKSIQSPKNVPFNWRKPLAEPVTVSI